MLNIMSWWQSAFAVFVFVFVVCRLVARRQKHPLAIFKPKKKTIMEDFVAQSAISKLEFEPYTFGISPLCQTIIFILFEVF